MKLAEHLLVLRAEKGTNWYYKLKEFEMSRLPKLHLRDLIWIVLVAAMLIDRVNLSRQLKEASDEVGRLSKTVEMMGFVKSRWVDPRSGKNVEGFENPEQGVRFRPAP